MAIAAGMGLALSPAASAEDTEEMIKQVLYAGQPLAPCVLAHPLHSSASHILYSECLFTRRFVLKFALVCRL